MSLKLRRPRDHRAAPGNPDDWDVLDGEGAIGRIFRSSSAPQDRPWMWTITGAVVAPRLPSHGFAETLDDAKAAFAQTWGPNGHGHPPGGRPRTPGGLAATGCPGDDGLPDAIKA